MPSNTRSVVSITSIGERIAIDLTTKRGLDLKTTRWLQHNPPHDDLPLSFDEVQFTWDSEGAAHDPHWQRLSDEQAEALTGESLRGLNRRLGDLGFQVDEEADHEGTATEGAA